MQFSISKSDCAPTMMSMMGLDGRPGTAVLPMCSMTQAGKSGASWACSAANWAGHSFEYSMMITGALLLTGTAG